MKEIKCKFNTVSGFVDIVNKFKKPGMVVAEKITSYSSNVWAVKIN